jgi:ribosomal protein S18 acetylase RimI-like enzyme
MMKMLRFEKAAPEDAPILAEVSKRAFHSDVNCGGSGEDGPPGYDSAEWQAQMMNYEPIIYYKVLRGDTIIGGLIVWVQGEGKYNLCRIFIDSEFHNQGIGTQAMDFVLKAFPDAKVWTLDTPVWNCRTRHFYEKLGFRINKIEGDSVLYEKDNIRLQSQCNYIPPCVSI